jgi:GTPase SAR1 family protein
MDSFLHLKNWLDQVKSQSEPDVLIFLVGNKKDMENQREVLTSKGEQFAKDNGLVGFFETSAKTGEEVETAFITAARKLFKAHYVGIREK